MVTFSLCLAAAPAAALTCLTPEVATSFERADEREDAFLVGLGSLQRTGGDVSDGPATGDPNRRIGYSFPARFEGKLANAEGFVVERNFDVTVEVGCVSAWCGDESLGEHGLYFLRRDEDGTYALEADPCGGFYFGDPSESQLAEVIGRIP